MKLTLNNIYTSISEATKDDIELLKSLFIISVPYTTKQKGQHHPVIKYYNVKFFKEPEIIISTGLLHLLIKEFEISEIIDDRIKPVDIVDISGSTLEAYSTTAKLSPAQFKLKPIPKLVSKADYSYQETAVNDAIKYERGLLHYPTGSGKTIIIAKIIAELNVNSLIIVPNLLLFNQTYNSFIKVFDKKLIGRLGDSMKDRKPITIATQQTLYSMLKTHKLFFDNFVSYFDCLFIDECHHIASNPIQWTKKDGQWIRKDNTDNSWANVAMEIPAYYRFGMTATLNTKDSPINQMVLESVTGRVISSITTKELIERNVLCPANIFMIKNECDRYKVWKNKYNKQKEVIEEGAYENNIISNVDRNKKIIELANDLSNKERKTLVLVDLVEKHGNILAKNINNSILLTGKANSETRKEGIERFKNSKNAVLIGTIFKEGFDLPEIDTLIIATGGKSEKNLIQKIGRVLRVAPNKDIAEVYDFYDEDNSMCERHSKSRLKIYKEQGYKVEII